MPNGFIALWRANRRARRRLKSEIRTELLAKLPEGPEGAAELDTRLDRVKDLRERLGALSAESPARLVEKIIVAGFGTLLLITTTLLISQHVPVTTIESELTLSEIGFSLAQDSPVLEPVAVEDVTIHDISSVTLPDGNAPRASLIQIRRQPAQAHASDSAQITLPGLQLPAGTKMSVRTSGPNRFEIEWEQAEAVGGFDIAAKGPVEVSLAGGAGNVRTRIDRPSQYGLHLAPSGKSLSVAFSIVRDSTVEFLPQIPVQKIDFGDSDSQSVSRGTSAILSGFLVRSELGSKKVALRRAEQFRLTGASWTAAQGDRITALLGRNTAAGGLRIRRVSLSKQGLKAEIYGQVASVAYGPAGVEHDGMPSKLEWIADNHRVKLIWAAIVFALGLLLGFARWFSKSS